MANSVDPDQTPRSAASDLDQHHLLRFFVCKLMVTMVLEESGNGILNGILNTDLRNEE